MYGDSYSIFIPGVGPWRPPLGVPRLFLWGEQCFLKTFYVLYSFCCSKAWGFPSSQEEVHTKITLSLSSRLARGMCRTNYGELCLIGRPWFPYNMGV